MKIVSWNINGGLKQALDADGEFHRLITDETPDIVCLQEVKTLPDNVEKMLGDAGYNYNQLTLQGTFTPYTNCERGYSGCTTLVNMQGDYDFSSDNMEVLMLPKMTDHRLDSGRGIITVHHEERLIIANLYVPNGGQSFCNREYKSEWMEMTATHINNIRIGFERMNGVRYGVIVLGDLNCCMSRTDLARPDSNWNKTPGYSQWEQDLFSEYFLGKLRLKDIAELDGKAENRYTFWSRRLKTNRERNVGWRLDYFLADDKVLDTERDSSLDMYRVLDSFYSSDHCPIKLTLNYI